MSIVQQAGYFVVQCATRVRLGADADDVAAEIVDWTLIGPEAIPERAYRIADAALTATSKQAEKVAAQQKRSIASPRDVWRLARIPANDTDPDVEAIGQIVAAMARHDLAMAYDMIAAHADVAGVWGLLGVAAGTTGLLVCLMEEDPTILIGRPRSA